MNKHKHLNDIHSRPHVWVFLGWFCFICGRDSSCFLMLSPHYCCRRCDHLVRCLRSYCLCTHRACSSLFSSPIHGRLRPTSPLPPPSLPPLTTFHYCRSSSLSPPPPSSPSPSSPSYLLFLLLPLLLLQLPLRIPTTLMVTVLVPSFPPLLRPPPPPSYCTDGGGTSIPSFSSSPSFPPSLAPTGE